MALSGIAEQHAGDGYCKCSVHFVRTLLL